MLAREAEMLLILDQEIGTCSNLSKNCVGESSIQLTVQRAEPWASG
jgi:hypothetical protein